MDVLQVDGMTTWVAGFGKGTAIIKCNKFNTTNYINNRVILFNSKIFVYVRRMCIEVLGMGV